MIMTESTIRDERMSVCLGCDKTKDMKGDPMYFFVDLLGNILPNASTLQCTECGCALYVKVRVPANTCPLNKWKE